MNTKTRNWVILIAVVIGIILIANTNPLIINLPAGTEDNANQPPSYQPPTYNPPEYPDYPAPPENSRPPTSLYVVVEPNPVTMENYVYGSVTGNGYLYPITIHAKHVGEGTEETFGALLDDDGQFYHSQTVDIPGYWDFSASTDTGVTSNVPRLTVQGALIASSKTSFSRTFGGMTATVKVFSHSSGSCLIFVNDPDAGTSTPLETVHINSGGYASVTVNFGVLSLGYYELDMVVNGIKASDYSASVNIFLGR